MSKAFKSKGFTIILASKSPRRIAVLKQIGVNFKVMESDIQEEKGNKENSNPRKLVLKNAKRKALYVAERINSGVILGFDTIVCFQDKILGKPKNTENAIQILSLLSGKWHTVITGVVLIKKENNAIEIKATTTTTKVRMRSLQEKEIRSYVRTKEPLDKAGAYGIQEKGAILIKEIKGDYYNVVGLPVSTLYKLAQSMDVSLL